MTSHPCLIVQCNPVHKYWAKSSFSLFVICILNFRLILYTRQTYPTGNSDSANNSHISDNGFPVTNRYFNARLNNTILHIASTAFGWRHNGSDGVPNHRRLDCLPNRLYRRRSKKTPKLRVTGLCEGNPPVTGGFLSQRVSNAENVSILWRHHGEHDCTGEQSGTETLPHSSLWWASHRVTRVKIDLPVTITSRHITY